MLYRKYSHTCVFSDIKRKAISLIYVIIIYVNQKHTCRSAKDITKLKQNEKRFWSNFQTHFNLIGDNPGKEKLTENSLTIRIHR